MAISTIFERSYDMLGNIAEGAQLAYEDEVRDIKKFFSYVERDGFLGSIATLLHRIWNAVWAILGISDWQMAEKALIRVIGRCVDKFTSPEFAIRVKVEMGKGIPSDDADRMLETLNSMNRAMKNAEVVALPVFESLLSSVNWEKMSADLSLGVVPNALIVSFQGEEFIPYEQRVEQLLQYAFEKEYIKPEARDIYTQVGAFAARLAQAQRVADRIL